MKDVQLARREYSISPAALLGGSFGDGVNLTVKLTVNLTVLSDERLPD